MYPEDYRYSKEHEWVHVEGDTGTIGITDHAQHELGDIVDLNGALSDAPEKLNEDPHGEAWLVRIRLSDPGELANLLSAAEYQTYIGAEK